MTTSPLGIDISKLKFDACLIPDSGKLRHKVFPNSSAGFSQLSAWLAGHGVRRAHACLEATGAYGEALSTYLHEAGHVVSVINPSQVALFARSLPRRGKTDALDAQLLLRFAAERQPAAWSPPEQVYHELRQRLVVRDGLLHMRTQAKNQRHAIMQWPVRIASALGHSTP